MIERLDAKQLANYRKRLYSLPPLIWLRPWRKAVEALVADCSDEAIRILVEAGARNDNKREQRVLMKMLQQLSEQHKVGAQEALCRLVITHDHTLAREIALKIQCAPCEAHERALFYFLTEQWEKYESLDFDQTFLRMAYEMGDERLRGRIVQQGRQSGRIEWIEVVTGGRQRRRLGEMTDEEWNAALTVLLTGQRWEELWRLAQDAPPRRSVQILQRMNGNGWALSKEDEQRECEKLVGLAMEWKEPDPRLCISRSSIYCYATMEHGAHLSDLAISPDGRLLASGSRYVDTVRLWSLPSGGLIKTFEERAAQLAFSPDGRLLVVQEGDNDQKGDNKVIQVRSLPDGAIIKTLYLFRGSTADLALSPDGRLLADRKAGFENNVVQLWSLTDGKLIKKLKGHRRWIRALTISQDGRLLASHSLDQTWTVKLWSLPDGALINTLSGNTLHGFVEEPVYYPINSQAGRMLVRKQDGAVELRSLPDGKFIKALEVGRGRFCHFAISLDGRLLAISHDKTVRLWSLPDGALINTLINPADEGPFGNDVRLAISPDGRLLVTGSGDGKVRLWKPNTIRLCELPIVLASRSDFEWVQETLRNGKIAESERRTLEFMAALMHLRRRFDIEVGEAAQRIEVGEFDIEIEG